MDKHAGARRVHVTNTPHQNGQLPENLPLCAPACQLRRRVLYGRSNGDDSDLDNSGPCIEFRREEHNV